MHSMYLSHTTPMLSARTCNCSIALCFAIYFFLQLIDDKKTLSERCESLVNELKQVDQKYSTKIRQMQEQHDTVR